MSTFSSSGAYLWGYVEAVQITRMNFLDGVSRPIEFRIDQLKRMLKLFKENEFSMTQALKLDMGKPAFEATLYEIGFIKNDIIYVLNNIKNWLKPKKTYKRLIGFFGQPEIYRDPYGVVYIVGSSTYPLHSIFLPLASAIAAGNCAIIKPHVAAKNTYKLLVGVLNAYLHVGCYLITRDPMTLDPKIDYLFFSGAYKEAQYLQSLCAKSLIPATYVVGSQNPVYIDDSADMLKTVQRVMWGKCVNAGQSCIAPGYILCSKEVMANFLKLVPQVIEHFYGDPKQSPDYARIISKENYDTLVRYLEGKEIAYGGARDPETLYIGPTIVTNVSFNYSLITDNDIFGPILPILTVQGVDEVTAFLTAREKPLALYIFSRDKTVVQTLLENTSSGGVTVNDVLLHFASPNLPFGGVGRSGFGNYHGKKTFDTLSHEKSVLKKSLITIIAKIERVRYPPYNEKKLQVIMKLMKKRQLLNLRVMNYVFAFLLGVFFALLFPYFYFLYTMLHA